MAVAYDTSGSGSITTGTSVTFSNNCSGSNRVLLAFATDNGAGTVTFTATKGGSATSMTLLNREAGGLAGASFYMVAPDSGVSSNIVATISSSGYIVAQTISFTGADQGASPDNTVKNNYNAAGSTTISQAITPVVSNCIAVIGGFYNANTGTVSAGANTTVVQSTVNASGLNGLGYSNSATTGGSPYTLNLTATVSAGRASHLVTIAPASGASVNSRFLAFM